MIEKNNNMGSKISVIVPVYNGEECISRCVDSIILQSFTDWELILIDDGSVDASCLICDDYAQKDTRIKVVHKKNGGVSTARNRGTITLILLPILLFFSIIHRMYISLC